MSRHTPGPWHWTGTRGLCNSSGQQVCRAADYDRHEGAENKDERVANERLIAAAPLLPEMAELLRDMMTAHRAQLPSEAADLYGGGCGCPHCEGARAILAKWEASNAPR